MYKCLGDKSKLTFATANIQKTVVSGVTGVQKDG